MVPMNSINWLSAPVKPFPTPDCDLEFNIFRSFHLNSVSPFKIASAQSVRCDITGS